MDPSNQHKHDSTSGQRQRIILRKPRKRGLASVSEVAKAALKVRKENPFLVKRGVPSLLRPSITLRQETTEPTHAGDHDRNDNSSFNDGDNNDDGNSNGDESFWSDSDTMLVIRSLQQGVESNVPIPLRGRTGGSSPPLLLRAVVECQVHARLATLRPSGVASELNDLLRQGLIVQLRTPDKTVNPHQASVAMLLTQQDWERGVRDALRGLVCTRDDGIEIHTINTIAEWFLERVKNEWAGFHSITSMQFKAALTKHPLGGPSVVADSNNTIACISMLDETKIMNCLQQIQVILPTNNHWPTNCGSPNGESY